MIHTRDVIEVGIHVWVLEVGYKSFRVDHGEVRSFHSRNNGEVSYTLENGKSYGEEDVFVNWDIFFARLMEEIGKLKTTGE